MADKKKAKAKDTTAEAAKKAAGKGAKAFGPGTKEPDDREYGKKKR